MLYTYAVKFDVTENFEKFLVFGWIKQCFSFDVSFNSDQLICFWSYTRVNFSIF